MAKEQKPAEQNPAPVLTVPAAQGTPQSYRLQIMLGLVAFILFMVLILWTLLPSPKEVHDHFVGPNPMNVDNAEPVKPVPPVSSEPMVEIPLQKELFKIKQLRDEETENLAMRIHVVVRKKEEAKFNKQYAQYTLRVLDRVGEVLTTSSRKDREDPEHNTIKEKLQKGINEVIGTPWVQEVLISEYTFTVE